MIQTDNAANVVAIAREACENPHVMHMIRLLTADQIKGDFSVRLQYIPTDLNTDADALSRGDLAAVMRRKPNLVCSLLIFPENFLLSPQNGRLTEVKMKYCEHDDSKRTKRCKQGTVQQSH